MRHFKCPSGLIHGLSDQDIEAGGMQLLPADCVELSDDEVAELRKPSSDDLSIDARAKRDSLLTACDWTQVSDAPVDQAAWREYRQLLRDITLQSGFPSVINWPEVPAE